MKAKYLGNPTPDSDGPMRVGYCGKTFPRGVFVSLEGVEPKQAAKLRANPFFAVSDEPMTDAETGALEEAGGDAPIPVAAASDEIPGDKDALLAALTAIKEKHPEVEFSTKMGVPKLKAILEEARFVYDDDAEG